LAQPSLNLEDAYEACRKETAQWAKTFYLGTMLLPPAKRRAIWAIYVWCRRTDELMDSTEAQKKSRNEFSDRLNKWEDKTKNIFAGNTEDDLDAVLADTLQKFPQSIQPYIDMIEGQRMDLDTTRYKTFEELELYCYRVAGTVGLMMAKILKVKDTRSLKGAIDLGIAMQLTNIARDVIEDKKMNRQYIKPDFENIEATLKLADMFYESSFSSIKKIPFKYRFAIIVARRVYRQIGRKIIQKRSMENYEKSGKIYVNNFEKIYQTILSMFDLILLFLKDVESHQRIKEHKIISEEVDLDERI